MDLFASEGALREAPRGRQSLVSGNLMKNHRSVFFAMGSEAFFNFALRASVMLLWFHFPCAIQVFYSTRSLPLNSVVFETEFKLEKHPN